MYPYHLVRSAKRRTISICIRQDLQLEVRAPKRASQREIDAAVEAHAGWIESHLQEQKARNEEAIVLTPELEQELIQKAWEILPQRIRYFSEIMQLTPAGIGITKARTRFGSCSAKNRINFSFRLMACPPEAVDYVVVHELAHIRHKNHGKDFYRLIGQVLPDYRDRIALLKDPKYHVL